VSARLESTLTEQQIEGRKYAFYDLATGYPALPLDQELAEVVAVWTRRSLGSGGHVGARQCDDPDIEMLLKEAVGSLLNIDRNISHRIKTTFSGSVAVDRVFAAARALAAASSRSGLTAIIAEPSVDLFRLLLRDRPDVRIVAIQTGATPSASGWHGDLLIDALLAEVNAGSERQVLVMLDSPANPSGVVADAEQLLRLATECGRAGALLVVDHCFVLAGVHAPARLPTVFDVPAETCDWIGIWDTGKTIDLNGDKLGFIVPGNDRVERAVDVSLSMIQSSAARRSLIVFAQLLGHPRLKEHIARLGQACRANLNELRILTPTLDLPSTPDAGTFACVGRADYDHSGDQMREQWLAAGVATVSGRTFFSSSGPGNLFVRISLARTQSYFREAISRMAMSRFG
jgi:histidinol-phosphate/aromatic aminotransferase/cobyric acid decarboxylase-like protein